MQRWEGSIDIDTTRLDISRQREGNKTKIQIYSNKSTTRNPWLASKYWNNLRQHPKISFWVWPKTELAFRKVKCPINLHFHNDRPSQQEGWRNRAHALIADIFLNHDGKPSQRLDWPCKAWKWLVRIQQGVFQPQLYHFWGIPNSVFQCQIKMHFTLGRNWW